MWRAPKQVSSRYVWRVTEEPTPDEIELTSPPPSSTASNPEDEGLTPDERDDLTAAEPEARRVVYSGQDFDVDGLVRRVRSGDIKVPQFGHNNEDIETAGFQRGFV